MTANFYRSDIDGLRAIAVLGVILYHFQPSWMPGGFTGVDIFFVISGYVISRHLREHLAIPDYSIWNFYARRVRRILPALLLVVSTSLVAGWFLMIPTDYAQIARSAIFGTLGMSNIYFLRHTGYFDPVAETQPLLHTWSLGVEEQFYLVWPLLLWLGLRRFHAQPVLTLVFILLAFISMAAAEYSLRTHSKLAFYLPHLRAWEFLVGCIAALQPCIRNRMVAETMGLTGCGLIAWSFATLSATIPFPGVSALYACVGTLLLVWPKHETIYSARMLAIRPLVSIGLISYGLYLWHWPLLIFYRFTQPHHPLHATEIVMLSLATLILAILSYYLVEKPARLGGRKAVAISLGATMLVVASAILVKNSEGFPARMPKPVRQLAAGTQDFSTLRPTCHRNDTFNPPLKKSCIRGDQHNVPQIAVWGDSHGVELADALGTELEKRQRSLVMFTYSSCPPAQHFTASLEKGCAAFNQKVQHFLLHEAHLKTVVLIAYHEFYLQNNPQENFLAKLEETVSALSRAGKNVILIASSPKLPGISIPQEAARLALQGRLKTLTISRENHMMATATSRAALEKIAVNYPGTVVFDPAATLCMYRQCSMVQDGHVVLFDDNHLSLTAALRVARDMLQMNILQDKRSKNMANAS